MHIRTTTLIRHALREPLYWILTAILALAITTAALQALGGTTTAQQPAEGTTTHFTITDPSRGLHRMPAPLVKSP